MKDLRDTGGGDLRDDSTGNRFSRARPAPSASQAAPADPEQAMERADTRFAASRADAPHAGSAASSSEEGASGSGHHGGSAGDVFSAGDGRGFVRFVGQGWPLLKLYVINLLFTVFTLGVYSFWGKTRIRQYLWTRTLVMGEPLEYTGTGWQLFRSFLIVISLIFGFNLAIAVLGLVNLVASVVVSMIFSLVLVLLWPYAIYCAMRFRLSRTCWRGIHGRMDGNPLEFAAQAWVRGMLTGVSLGLFFPYMVAFLTRFTVQSSFFGTERFGFEGSARRLAQRYWGCWLMGAMATGMIVFGYCEEAAVMIMGIIGLALDWFIWRVQRINWTIDGVRFGQASFEGRVTVPGYAWLTVSNWALVVVTLGVFYPWARVRFWRYMMARINVRGSIDLSGIRQDNAALVKNGEGLLGILDLDLGF